MLNYFFPVSQSIQQCVKETKQSQNQRENSGLSEDNEDNAAAVPRDTLNMTLQEYLSDNIQVKFLRNIYYFQGNI